MEFIRILNIQQNVCRVGLGTWAIGGWMWGGTDEADAIRTIHHALDKGINLIDTAPAYGFGKAEEIVGKALKQYGGREKIVLATKVGLEWKNEKEVFRNSTRNRILKEIDDSLRRLQVTYIDLYQIHWPDLHCPISETAETMQGLLDSGKIRAIGVSNYSIDQMKEFMEKAQLDVNQCPFNLFESESKTDLLPFCFDHKIAILGYSSLCRGLLTGKIKADTTFKEGDLRKDDPKFNPPGSAKYFKCVEALEKWVMEKYKRPIAALAVRWSLDHDVSVALWGARHPKQLELIDSVWGWKLSPDDLKEIDRILTETLS
jgi:aryl-alcohol dehydrogenase-like predicted oxidoreductase